MWSWLTPNISHLHIFGCSAYVTINKKKGWKLDLKSREMTFIGYKQGSKGYQFWDKDSQSVVISHDVKFNESKFPHRKDLDYKNPFTNEKRQSTSVKNWRKTTDESDESDSNTEEGLVIPSTSDSDDDHRPLHPAPPPPSATPTMPPKSSPGSKKAKERKPSTMEKTTRPDEKPSTTISPEPNTWCSIFRSMRPWYNLWPWKWVRHNSLKEIRPQKDLVQN